MLSESLSMERQFMCGVVMRGDESDYNLEAIHFGAQPEAQGFTRNCA